MEDIQREKEPAQDVRDFVRSNARRSQAKYRRSFLALNLRMFDKVF